MSSSPSDLIKFEKQTTGENASTWGTLANQAMSRIEEAIAGMRSITLAGGSYTLNDDQYAENSGTTAESHLMIIKATGSPGASRKIVVPLRTKLYLIWNAVTTYDLTVGGSSGDTVTIPNGRLAFVFCDGTNVEFASPLINTAGAIITPTAITVADESSDATCFPLFATAATGDLAPKSAAGLTFASDSDTLSSTILKEGSTRVGLQGVHTIWVPAAAMRPTSANGCASIINIATDTDHPDMQVLDFDKDADEHAQFQIMFPKSWNLGTIQYQVVWAGIAATTGVSWFLQGVAVSDNESIDVAYGTAVKSQDDAQGAVEEILVSPVATVTIGGSPADNDLCFFRIYRDISDGDDDMAGDARLIGIRILFTTDAGNDA